MAMIVSVGAAVRRLMVDPMLYHKIAYALTTTLWYWNSEYTYDTWFVCGSRRACACGGTNSKIAYKPCSTPHTETVSPMNGCVCAAFDPIRLQTFYHIHRTDKHEHLCAGFECVAANLMRQWIPGREYKEKVKIIIVPFGYIYSLLLLLFSLLNNEHVFHSHCICFEIRENWSLWMDFSLWELTIVCEQIIWIDNRSIHIVMGWQYSVSILLRLLNLERFFSFDAWWNNFNEMKICFFLHYYYYWMLRNKYSFCQTRQYE